MVLNPAETEDAAMQLALSSGVTVGWDQLSEAQRVAFRRQASGIAAGLPDPGVDGGMEFQFGPVRLKRGRRA